MKKILALILTVALLLPFCACSSPSLQPLSAGASQTAEETVAGQKDKGEIVIPEGFSAGFGRREIVNDSLLPIPTFDGNVGAGIEALCYVTSVAVSDGENIVLLLSFDLRGADSFLVRNTKRTVSKKFGIPEENILICATHNHAGPDMGRQDGVLGSWYSLMFSTFIPEAVEESLRDLSPSRMYGGTADTTGINFVRRYLLSDGTWKTNPTAGGAVEILEHESEADPEMRVIQFEREDKKPIVLVNWQCHPASSYSGGTVNTDFIHKFRQGSEKQYGILFSYYQGAAGDVIHRSAIEGETRYKGYNNVGTGLVPVLGKALSNLTELETGPIKVLHSDLEGELYTLSEVKAQATKDYNATTDVGKRNVIMAQAGIEGRWEINRNLKVLRYHEKGQTTTTLPHTAIAIGDWGIATAGYEMFHQNGQDVRAASPFKMTFVCAYTDENLGYIPTSLAFSHGDYEVFSCIFTNGQGELCANEMIRLLREVAK